MENTMFKFLDFDYAPDYTDFKSRQRESDGKVPLDMIEEEKSRREAWIQNIPEYPADNFAGRGVVMVAGGTRYLTCAYVNVTMLRRAGCTLPVELWFLGKREVDHKAKKLFEHLGDVVFKDVEDYIHECPFRKIGGWEMNVYSIINSSFEEVFFLDADNTVLIDIEEAFEWPQYKQTGAVFWPDYGRLSKGREIWSVMDTSYRDEPEFESGQIVMNKEKCWKELQLTQYLNQYSDIYYKLVHGDKETYHMAWRSLGTEYSMIPYSIHRLRGCMSQHDFKKNIILQHRNMDKWNLKPGENKPINGFFLEDECFDVLQELRERWDGIIDPPMPQTKKEMQAFMDLQGKQMEYIMVDRGGSSRNLTLNADGTTRGAGHVEKYWYTKEVDGVVYLMLADNSVTAVLRQEGKAWKGFWTMNELFRVMLVPSDLEKRHPDRQYKTLARTLPQSTSVVFCPDTRKLADTISKHLPDVKKVGEIGAFSPRHSLAAYYAMEKGSEVFIVEPQPDKYLELREVLKETNSTIHPVAVAEEEGYANLYIPNDGGKSNPDAASSAYLDFNASPYKKRLGNPEDRGKPITVICRPFDSIDPGDIDACHIDVEGQEWKVLKNMKSRPRFLSIELFGPKNYVNPEIGEIENWLHEKNYYPAGSLEYDRHFLFISPALLDQTGGNIIGTKNVLQIGDRSIEIKLGALGEIEGDTDYESWSVRISGGLSITLHGSKKTMELYPSKEGTKAWRSSDHSVALVPIKDANKKAKIKAPISKRFITRKNRRLSGV